MVPVASDDELRGHGFDPARQRVARRYARARLLVAIGGRLFQGGALVLFALFGALPLRHALGSHVSGTALNALFALTLSLALVVLSLPEEALLRRIERRFKLSRQSALSILSDGVKEAILSAVLGTGALVSVYAVIATIPHPWLAAWAGASLFLLSVSFAAPVLIAPLFHRFTPLSNPALARRLADLAERAGVRVAGVFEMGAAVKTAKASAYLTGIGRTRRIVLSDTMIRSFPPDEVEVVIAHELGHHARRHLAARLAILSGEYLVASLAVWAALRPLERATGVGMGIESAPLLMLLAGGVLATLSPIGNALSRSMEREADRFAARLSGKPEALASVLARTSETNLRFAAPHRLIEALTYDHPSPHRRVRAVLGAAHRPSEGA